MRTLYEFSMRGVNPANLPSCAYEKSKRQIASDLTTNTIQGEIATLCMTQHAQHLAYIGSDAASTQQANSVSES